MLEIGSSTWPLARAHKYTVTALATVVRGDYLVYLHVNLHVHYFLNKNAHKPNATRVSRRLNNHSDVHSLHLVAYSSTQRCRRRSTLPTYSFLHLPRPPHSSQARARVNRSANVTVAHARGWCWVSVDIVQAFLSACVTYVVGCFVARGGCC